MTHTQMVDHGLVWRRALPVLLIPLGALYCQLFELSFGKEPWNPAGSLVWAGITLSPWVIAAIAFEHRVRAGDTRRRLLARAAVLAVAAYVASGLAAWAIGTDNFYAFYSRIPLIGAALLAAALYPVPGRSETAAPADLADPPVVPAQIAFASAAGNYVELHYGGRSTVWRQTMRNAERILAPAGFVRIHRCFLVPRHGIEAVRNGRKGPVAVALRDGQRLPVSHSYAANLRMPDRSISG